MGTKVPKWGPMWEQCNCTSPSSRSKTPLPLSLPRQLMQQTQTSCSRSWRQARQNFIQHISWWQKYDFYAGVVLNIDPLLFLFYPILSYTLGVDFKMAPHHKLGTATRPYAQVRRLWFDHWTSIILFIRDLDEKTLERKISLCREYLGVLDVIDAGISHNIGITAWSEDFFSLTNDNDLWRNCVWTFIQKFHTMLILSLHANCIDAISKD